MSKFLSDLFHVDRNASVGEKIATFIVPVLAAIFLIILFGSAAGLFNNALSHAAAKATAVEKIIGWVLFAVAAVWAWANWSDRVPFRINQTAATILLAVVLALSVLFLIGFDRAI